MTFEERGGFYAEFTGNLVHRAFGCNISINLCLFFV